jgi:hypothetical protein
MRDFKGMKRQRGRNRPGGGQGGGGGKPGNANRAFDSQGPENLKVRGSAQHIFEKYQQLARDATGAGDRVLLENYLQHAEHYYRLIRTLQPQRTPAEIMGRESLGNGGYDLDFEDEATLAMQNAAAEAGANAPEEPAAEDGGQPSATNQGQREFREPRDREGQAREGREFRDRDGRERDRGEFRRDREGGGREFRDGPRDGPREPRGDREFRDGPREGRDGPREGRGDREFRRDRDRDRPRDGDRAEGRFGERGRYGDRRATSSRVTEPRPRPNPISRVSMSRRPCPPMTAATCCATRRAA